MQATRYTSWLRTFPKYMEQPTLDRMKQLLELLGHPERRLPRRIQILGTNGKGSTTAMIGACYEAAGYRVGIYGSPGLTSDAEQIRFGTKYLEDTVFDDHLSLLEPVLSTFEERYHTRPTRFEVSTALACLLFETWNVDIALFEAGMGGRFDSTTALDCPVKTYTNVSLDHTTWLGDTIQAIAEDKCAAIQPGTTLVVSTFASPVLPYLEKRCFSVGAEHVQPLEVFSDTFQYEHMLVDVTTVSKRYHGLTCRLVGLHQVYNTALAIQTVESSSRLFNCSVPEAAVRDGLEHVVFPGRFHAVSSEQFSDSLPHPPHILLDGAHNQDGMRKLLATHLALDPTAPVAIYAAKRPPSGELPAFVELASRCETVFLPRVLGTEHFLPPERTLRYLPPALRSRCSITPSLDAALFDATRLGEEEVRDVLITGSLYFLGYVYANHPNLLPAEWSTSPLPPLTQLP